MIDPDKLAPALERLRRNLVVRPGERNFLMADIKEVCDQADLAAQAFGVMMRRGWGLVRRQGKWYVYTDDPIHDTVRRVGPKGYRKNYAPFTADDPFTVLVEADRWYRENVEAS